MRNPIVFTRGEFEFEISLRKGGGGYIGIRNGRVSAAASDPAAVARALILAERFRNGR
jgi:transcriptional regulator CtsR